MEMTRSTLLRGTLAALCLPAGARRAAAKGGASSGPAAPQRPGAGAGSGAGGGGKGPARLSSRVIELRLRHAWTLSRNTSSTKRNVVVELHCDGVTGLGEAAPNVRFGESAETVLAALQAAAPIVAAVHPSHVAELAARLKAALPEAHAARCALDLAIWDWNGKALGAPLWRQLGLDAEGAPQSSFSLSIAAPEELRQKAREAAAFPLLKLKLGAKGDGADRQIVETVRAAAPEKLLRVDPNEGWTPAEAREKLRWLASLRRGPAGAERPAIELCEQPLPAKDLGALQALYRDAHREHPQLPILLDESVLEAADIPRLAGACDGIVVKLQKAGGVTGALQQIAVARALGMKVMIGCMIESSLGISAAAQLGPLCDYADLDGALLVDNDPFRGAVVEAGRIALPAGPGLGVQG